MAYESGPVVLCIRGSTRSGKTSLASRLIGELGAGGTQVAYIKRTHHLLDLPQKSSARIWNQEPAAMVLRATDRVQLSLPPGEGSVCSLLAQLPPGIDVVLVETHSHEPYPTFLSTELEATSDEQVAGRWNLLSLDEDAPRIARQIREWLPRDRVLDGALRAAMALHGGHACAGLVLGTRLALLGPSSLDVEVPDQRKRLVVTAETDRCAVDAIQAVTGCRPGKRTLRILDYGKLAATFIDQWSGRAVRVAARGGLRERVGASGDKRHALQRAAYLSWDPSDLFTVQHVTVEIDQFDLPGPPRRRMLCAVCNEEVSDGRELVIDHRPVCRPCAAAPHADLALSTEASQWK